MKMKKKDIIINILCVLWISLVLILKFNGEYKIEQIEDFTQLNFLRKENLVIVYVIEKNSGTLNENEFQQEGLIERQLAHLCILEDGSVYYLNTSQPMVAYLNDNLPPHIEPNLLPTLTYSAYYMGRLSTLDLLFLKCNRALISPWAMEVGAYPSEESPAEGTEGGNIESEDGYSKEQRQQHFIFELYGIDEKIKDRINVCQCIITEEYWNYTLDINALILIPWLRTSWHYREYIDLMYQELYPWLVEE